MAKKKTRRTKNKEGIKIAINAKVYPLEAIYAAAYVFLDKAYIFLEGDPAKKIFVNIKSKEEDGPSVEKKIKGEFLNELINCGLRQKISEKNSKLREYIVGAALLGASGKLNVFPASAQDEDEAECDCSGEDGESTEEDLKWEDDPLGIAVPWEDKFLKEESPKNTGKKAAKGEALKKRSLKKTAKKAPKKK